MLPFYANGITHKISVLFMHTCICIHQVEERERGKKLVCVCRYQNERKNIFHRKDWQSSRNSTVELEDGTGRTEIGVASYETYCPLKCMYRIVFTIQKVGTLLQKVFLFPSYSDAVLPFSLLCKFVDGTLKLELSATEKESGKTRNSQNKPYVYSFFSLAQIDFRAPPSAA